MSLFSRYVFRQVANAFVIILVTLTTIVWLATALKQLDLIVSQGQGFVLFLKMTFLTLPSLMALIAPNAMLMASLYTLDRMNGDSELIVMTAAGAPAVLPPRRATTSSAWLPSTASPRSSRVAGASASPRW